MTKRREKRRKTGGAGLGRRAREGLSSELLLRVREHEKRDVDEAAAALKISTSRFAAEAALHDAKLVLAGLRARALTESRSSVGTSIAKRLGAEQGVGSAFAGAGLERRARGILAATLQVTLSANEKRDVDLASRALGITTNRFATRAVLREAQLALAGFRARPWAEGLRFRHLRILKVIERQGGDPVSIGFIRNELNPIDLGLLSRVITEMERLGLVGRQRIAKRRGVFVKVTGKGRRAWQHARLSEVPIGEA